MPVDLMTRVVGDLIEFGEVRRGYVGVEIGAVTAEVARRQGLDRIAGVVVENVASEGAAARAGIRVGDVLLSIDGREIDAPNQFQSAIALRRPGDVVSLNIWRRGSEREMEVNLIGRDDQAFQAWAEETGLRPVPPREEPPGRDPIEPELPLYEPEFWGVGLRDLTQSERERFGVEAGALITYVRPGGMAGIDGLPSQTVITHIEDRPIASAEQAQNALERAAMLGEPALVRVMRPDGITAYYDLEPAIAEAR